MLTARGVWQVTLRSSPRGCRGENTAPPVTLPVWREEKPLANGRSRGGRGWDSQSPPGACTPTPPPRAHFLKTNRGQFRAPQQTARCTKINNNENNNKKKKPLKVKKKKMYKQEFRKKKGLDSITIQETAKW